MSVAIIRHGTIDKDKKVVLPLKTVDSVFDKPLNATDMMPVVLMLLLALFIFTQVATRYVFRRYVPGSFDVSIYSLIIFTFITGAYALKEGP